MLTSTKYLIFVLVLGQQLNESATVCSSSMSLVTAHYIGVLTLYGQDWNSLLPITSVGLNPSSPPLGVPYRLSSASVTSLSTVLLGTRTGLKCTPVPVCGFIERLSQAIGQRCRRGCQCVTLSKYLKICYISTNSATLPSTIKIIHFWCFHLNHFRYFHRFDNSMAKFLTLLHECLRLLRRRAEGRDSDQMQT